MKITYTILFFTCTLLLITFSILVLQYIDASDGIGKILLAIGGDLCVIIIMGIVLNKYFMIPPGDR
ncbi:MAG: hypothetical protein ABIW47_18295 [Ginsengibacter sp.]|jgi:hypothetical protein